MTAADFQLVLDLIENGLSLRKAMLQVGVTNGTFFRYVDAVDGASEQYARARTRLLEYWSQDIIEIQDEKPEYVEGGENQGARIDPGFVAWQKNRVEARRWLLVKLMPKVYSDKLAVTGEDGGPLRVLALSKDDVDL